MNNKVYVGNVSWSVTNEDLTDAFSSFGKVTQAAVVVDRDTNRSRGFAFVTFETENEATAAIEGMDGQEIKGRAVRVSFAQQRAQGERRERGTREVRGERRW